MGQILHQLDIRTPPVITPALDDNEGIQPGDNMVMDDGVVDLQSPTVEESEEEEEEEIEDDIDERPSTLTESEEEDGIQYGDAGHLPTEYGWGGQELEETRAKSTRIDVMNEEGKSEFEEDLGSEPEEDLGDTESGYEGSSYQESEVGDVSIGE